MISSPAEAIKIRVVFVVLAALLCAAQLPAATLDVSSVDSDGSPVWARYEVRGADGQMYKPADAVVDSSASVRQGNERWYHGSFVAKQPAAIELPAGTYTLVVERGTEFRRHEQRIEFVDGETKRINVELEPWIRMNQRGWWSGDFHVHRDPADVPALVQAEDLNLAVVFTMWNQRDLWEREPWPSGDIREVTPGHLMTILNAEDERGGGAWMFHRLKQNLGLAGHERWFPAGIEFIEGAKKQRDSGQGFPWFDCEKPFWREVPVVMALSPPDSMGLIHNHFNQYGVLANEAWGRPRDTKKYPGREGFVASSLDLYYRYLNLGFTTPASAGSASGVLPNPVGYNRVYVKLDGEFSVEGFYDGLRSGESFVTNGPMLFLQSEASSGGKRIINATALSREPLDRIELVGNGRIIETHRIADGQSESSTSFTVDETKYSWVAVRCYARTRATVRMAHSQAIQLKGHWDAGDDAKFFVDWIDELIEISERETDRFSDASKQDAVIDIYRRARKFYADLASR